MERTYAERIPPSTLTPYDSILPASVPDETPTVTSTILMIGSAGSGKTTFAKSLQAVQRNGIQIRETRTLPLEKDETRPRTDAVILFVDLHNASSLLTLKSNIQHLHSHFFLNGSVFIIGSRAEKPSRYAFSTSELESISEKYESPLFFCDLTDTEQSINLAKRILKNLELLNFTQEGTLPLLLKTLDSVAFSS